MLESAGADAAAAGSYGSAAFCFPRVRNDFRCMLLKKGARGIEIIEVFSFQKF